MKLNKSVLLAFALLIILGSVCRVFGFAPQIAMAVFGGAVIKDKRLGFILPLVSMFFSDVLFQVLYLNGLTDYGGFYPGQITNYIILGGLTLIGFWVRGFNWQRIVVATLSAPVVYFLLSNFAVWLGGGGLQRPKTFSGLLMCYQDALPFFRSSLMYTILFSVLLFGGYYLLYRRFLQRKQLA
jgi:hypothetical protein